MGFNRHWIDETNAARSIRAPPSDPRRHDHRHRRRLPRHDVRLRALPRSQVRSNFDQGLLPPAGLLRQHHFRRWPAAPGRSRGQAQVRRAICGLGRQDQRHPRRDGEDHGAGPGGSPQALSLRDDGRSASRRRKGSGPAHSARAAGLSHRRNALRWPGRSRKIAQGRQRQALCRAENPVSHVRIHQARAAAAKASS